MALTTTCPNCQALFRLPTQLAGRKVKCQKCQELFVVGRAEPAPVEEEPEPEEERERPSRVRAALPPPYVKKADEDEDDEDDEDERRPRKRSRERESRRPAKKRPAKSQSNVLMWVLIGGGVCLVLCIGLSVFVGALIFILNAAGSTNVEFGPDGVFRSNGVLTTRDPLKNGRHHRVYTARLEAGRTYHIDMVSQQVDSFLVLTEGNGRVIAQDDDGGGFPNARIIFRPQQTGDFRIEATNFGTRATGAYTLTVRRI